MRQTPDVSARSALYYDPIFLEHDTVRHPESPARVEACIRLLEEAGIIGRVQRPACRDATPEELLRIHTPGHVELVKHAGAEGPVMLTPDTVANAGTFAAAVRAAGACTAATEAVVRGDFESAFCLTRPPGHHATPQQPMGFCFFNNVAIAARHATVALGLERVAIVDIDLHHGNGTQDAFWEDGSVLYISTHQDPYYPGSGHWREAGAGAGLGATLNLPLPGGCGDVEFARLHAEVILPKLRQFAPQLILVSAGYDAHFADPIDGAMLRLSCAGYASIVAGLRDVARELCDGRIVLALEGGYDLRALSWSLRNSIETLLDEPATPDPLGLPPPPRQAPKLDELIEHGRTLHGLV
jgi:acetoin utilization deacetylase AcuC-like enzyme